MPVKPPAERVAGALRVLGDADALVAEWSCTRCDAAESGPEASPCCRFATLGREPWLTEVEWRVIETALRNRGRRMPAVPQNGDCPFLDGRARCTIYDVRPLGCRTWFCDESSSGPRFPRKEIARLPRALDDLSAPSDRFEDLRPRPLTSWVRGASRPRTSR